MLSQLSEKEALDMLVKKRELSSIPVPWKVLSKKYMQEIDLKPGKEHTFRFDFPVRTGKGDTHIRQVGTDPAKYSSDFSYYVMRDKHGNHADSADCILATVSLIYGK